MFGTFLCNNSRERTELNIATRTFSVWSLLQSPQYTNHLYSLQDQVLWPSCAIRDLEFWRELYLGTSSIAHTSSPQQNLFPLPNQDNNANVETEYMNGEDLNGNGEEQNGHLEEFNLGRNQEDKCKGDKENGDTVGVFGRTIYNSPNNGEVSSAVSQKIEIGDNTSKDRVCKNDQVIELETSVESSTENQKSPNVMAVFPKDSPVNSTPEPSGSGPPNFGSGRPALDPVDGLTPLRDEVQQRLAHMVLEQKALERELHTTRLALLQQVCHQCHPHTPPERPDRDDDGSVCSTEVSWEAVEEHDTMPTLWVPDHAVSHCYGCQNIFWLGRRKHHCRRCGKIFCADCSENTVPLPEEQLYEPVRVCCKCYNSNPPPPATTHAPALTSTQGPHTTCKQAALISHA